MDPGRSDRVPLQDEHHLGLGLASKLGACRTDEERLEILTAWLEVNIQDVSREEALAMDSFLVEGNARQQFFRALNRTHPPNE